MYYFGIHYYFGGGILHTGIILLESHQVLNLGKKLTFVHKKRQRYYNIPNTALDPVLEKKLEPDMSQKNKKLGRISRCNH